jgi:hypothetical protein
VLAALTDDCVITESYGPVYHSRRRVEHWMRAWFGVGGSVDRWTITWEGKPATFEGATIARLEGEKITYLREYATSAPLYDWTGTWRD